MKINMPVTNHEVELSEHHTIVSKTDLRGQITYVNRDFLEISGFEEAELIGQSHNIVRHPDMPQEAFADLWNNLKAGRPWNGLVKNRCKNGDYYWVDANAAPLWENGSIVGYVSVRTRAERSRVDAASAAYRRFREGKADGLVILNGCVVRRPGRIATRLAGLSIRSRLALLMATACVSLALVSASGLYGTAEGTSGIERMHDRFLTQAGRFAELDEILMGSMVEIQRAASHNPALPSSALHAHSIETHLGTVSNNLAEMDKLLDEAQRQATEPALIEKIAAYRQAAGALRREGFEPVIELLRKASFEPANAHIAKGLLPIYENIEARADALRDDTLAAAKHEVGELKGQAGRLSTVVLGVAVAAMVILLLVGVGTIRAISLPLARAREAVRQLAAGNFRNHIPVDRHDEVGSMMAGLKAMQTQLGFEVQDQKLRAAETLRIKIGLDNVATNVMIADRDHRILYMNKSIERMFAAAEADIRKDLPNFGASRLMGQSIDLFHKNPAHQRSMLAALTGNHRSTVRIGGHTFTLSVTPVVDAAGERLGTAVEWVDRTAEVAIEDEVAGVVAAAAAGDFTRRIPVADKSGFYRQISEGLNSLVDTTARGLADVARVLDAIARGDLDESISTDYHGTFGQLKDDTNTTVARLREVVGRIQEATEAINTAAQEISAGNTDLSSRTEEQASSLQETASSMEELNATVRQNADNARTANELAHGSNAVAERGGEMMTRVVSTMSSIQESARKIADIIGVIDSIAFQTNILALNAAVEAARAGEQGRGFAVVASEVRSLAQRSAQAAKEIKGLIADSGEKVEDGAKLVGEAGRTMEEVVSNFQRLAGLVTEIANASREQSSGIEQVTRAVSQMDEVTQQNAALVEESAAAAESLEEQARGLQAAVSMFRLGGGAPVASRIVSPAASNVAELRAHAAKGSARRLGKPLSPSTGRKAAAVEDDWEAF